MEGRDEGEGCTGEMKGRDGGEREEGREGEIEGEKERERDLDRDISLLSTEGRQPKKV